VSLAQITTKQKHGVLQPTPLTGISSRDSKSRVSEESSLTSLTQKKVGVLGV
jgi:hypothetical protein